MFEYQKTFFYIKGFAKGAHMRQTLLALSIAEAAHEGQKRNGGDPYIIHPLRVAASLIALGVADDDIIAAALLHDVPEDTKVTLDDLRRKGINNHVCEIVRLVTKRDPYNATEYYLGISEEIGALLVKVADRCHNCSTMAVFKQARLEKYINETNNLIIPLIRTARQEYPEYEDVLFSFKYQIRSLCELAEARLRGDEDGEDN